MKQFAILISLICASQVFAASKSSRASQSLSMTDTVNSANTAVISTNVADISKNRANVSLDVMMTSHIAATLSYSTSSQEETRDHVAGKPKLTVDRTQFGFGADYYFKPLTALYNLAVTPALIFETEKDAVDTGSTTGLGLKAMGIFKPFPRLMAQAGGQMTVLGSETRTDLLVGMGLVF